MKLTKRLEAALNLVPPCNHVADVGTDHGYLAVALIKNEIAKKVLAIDVNAGPLASARNYVKGCQLEEKIECRLGDGLSVTNPGELAGAILCGMGGFLMRDILEAGPEDLDFYVLQPQNGQAELRKYLYQKGYIICRENLVKDMGKFYTAFLAIKKEKFSYYSEGQGFATLQELTTLYKQIASESLQWSIGILLTREKPKLWADYVEYLIQQRLKIIKALIGSQAELKIAVLKKEVEELESLR